MYPKDINNLKHYRNTHDMKSLDYMIICDMIVNCTINDLLKLNKVDCDYKAGTAEYSIINLCLAQAIFKSKDMCLWWEEFGEDLFSDHEEVGYVSKLRFGKYEEILENIDISGKYGVSNYLLLPEDIDCPPNWFIQKIRELCDSKLIIHATQCWLLKSNVNPIETKSLCLKDEEIILTEYMIDVAKKYCPSFYDKYKYKPLKYVLINGEILDWIPGKLYPVQEEKLRENIKTGSMYNPDLLKLEYSYCWNFDPVERYQKL